MPTVDTKDWPNTLETLVDHIKVFRGVGGHPLSYCLRDNLDISS